MIYRIDPRTDRRWQPFLETQRDASIFHTAAWLEALRRTYGYEPVVYTTTAPGRDLINGIPFCQVSSHLTGQRLVSLPFSDHCQPLADDPEEFDTLIAAVKWDARKYHSRYIEMKPIIPFDTRVMASSGLAKSHDAFIHRLDLRRRSDEVLRGFHKHCIGRKIARSERE